MEVMAHNPSLNKSLFSHDATALPAALTPSQFVISKNAEYSVELQSEEEEKNHICFKDEVLTEANCRSLRLLPRLTKLDSLELSNFYIWHQLDPPVQ